MLTLSETVEPSIAATGPYWSQFASVPLQNPSFLQRIVQWHRSCSESVGAMPKPMTSREFWCKATRRRIRCGVDGETLRQSTGEVRHVDPYPNPYPRSATRARETEPASQSQRWHACCLPQQAYSAAGSRHRSSDLSRMAPRDMRSDGCIHYRCEPADRADRCASAAMRGATPQH